MRDVRSPVLAAAVLVTLAAGGARAAAPYPRSALVAGLRWDTATYRSTGLGGDLWPTTAGADGKVYTAWGDGTVTCPARVSYGVASVAGGPSADLFGAGCGTPGDKAGKLVSLLDVAGTLYATVYLQGRPDTGAVAVWSSPDHGATWRRPAWTFPGAAGALQPGAFVQFGPGYAGARDRYVYLLAQKPGEGQAEVYLMRAPEAGLQTRAAYRYLAGSPSAPVWSALPAEAVPVFADPAGADGPRLGYDAGLHRYLLTAGHGGGDRVGVFEGPRPWGPWATVDYEDGWLGIGDGGSYLGIGFPSPWMADGGRSLWAVFSCWSSTKKTTGVEACGAYNDRYALMRATLTLAPARR